MDYTNFENNLINVIKESLIKLGYDGIGIGVNYVTPTLVHLLNCDESTVFDRLCTYAKTQTVFGDITISATDGGYRLNVSKQGVEYVNNLIDDNEFLVKFIAAMRDFNSTIDTIHNLFLQYSNNVHFEKVNNGEFDYLIYFENGVPDEFWYCIDTDDFGITYHRFIKQDYLDFNY